jgi:hypothetical protein
MLVLPLLLVLIINAGRKGFTDLMLAKGHSLENISIWMGHSTLAHVEAL